MLCSFEQWCFPMAQSSNSNLPIIPAQSFQPPGHTTPVNKPCVIIFPFPLFQRNREMERPVQAVGVVVDSVWSGVFCIYPHYDWEMASSAVKRKLVQRWDRQNEQWIYPFQFFHSGLLLWYGLFKINLQSGPNLYVRYTLLFKNFFFF